MRLIKGALYGLAGLAMLVTLISFLMPSEVHGRRGIVIQASILKIVPQLNTFYYWKNWQPDFMRHADKIRYEKMDKPEGSAASIVINNKVSTYTITSNNLQLITVLQKRPGQQDTENIFTLTNDTATGGTYVDWKFITKLKWYPWEKFAGIFMESMTAPAYEQALANLKQYTETH